VSSQSDFWWCHDQKAAFGGCGLGLMAKHYNTKFGCLAISDTTVKSMQKSCQADEIIYSTASELRRLLILGDFRKFDEPKTGENIGKWIETNHADLYCEPGYVISHVVDHASNAIDFVEVFKWNTRKSRPQEVITEGFMAHSTHTAAGLASGTTDHAANLNPQCGDHLTDLHDHLTILTRSKPRRDELANVRKEEGREKWNEVRARIQTRWGSEHDECSTSNQSQYGIDVTIKRNVSPTGPDRDKYRAHMKEHGNLDKAIILQRSWEFFQQYEGAMQPVRDIIRWCQSARVIFHEELFEERRMFELISSPYF